MRYKRAALKDHLGKITGTSAGALAGGLGGYGIASLFSDNKSIRILAALAGAVGGGYGGYRLGNYMDTQRAGLISKNTDLTNKYNASQDALQDANQQRDQTKGKLDAAQYNNQKLTGQLAHLKDSHRQVVQSAAYDQEFFDQQQKHFLDIKKTQDAIAQRLAYAQAKNKEAADMMKQQQAVIDAFMKHIPKNVQDEIFKIENVPYRFWSSR